MLIYTRQSSGRKKRSVSKRLLAAQDEHKKFLESHGFYGKRRKVDRPWTMPDLSYENRAAPLSNNIHTEGGFKKSVDDWKWKRGREEKLETVKEIERKKTRIAPAYNKGATMYITDGADPTTLGRKV